MKLSGTKPTAEHIKKAEKALGVTVPQDLAQVGSPRRCVGRAVRRLSARTQLLLKHQGQGHLHGYFPFFPLKDTEASGKDAADDEDVLLDEDDRISRLAFFYHLDDSTEEFKQFHLIAANERLAAQHKEDAVRATRAWLQRERATDGCVEGAEEGRQGQGPRRRCRRVQA